MRATALIAAIVFIGAGCGEGDTSATTIDATTAPITSEATTTIPVTETTAAQATTRTSFDAPPATAPNPERGPFVGIWRWMGTHTRYIQLFDHGVIGAGAIVEESLHLTRTGEWNVIDGVMTVTSLDIGPDPCEEEVGTYAIHISAGNLVMEIVDDPCEGRALWLLGVERDSRTWVPDDAEAP